MYYRKAHKVGVYVGVGQLMFTIKIITMYACTSFFVTNLKTKHYSFVGTVQKAYKRFDFVTPDCTFESRGRCVIFLVNN